MQILISPINLTEALIAWKHGTNIIDIKNTKEGSLGAAPIRVIREITAAINDPGVVFSATLGDLPYKPGTASQSAFGVINCGITYVKAGLFGPMNAKQGVEVMDAVVDTCKTYDPNITVVAAGYADCARFGGILPLDIVKIARQSKADMVMLDTYYKDGRNLFDSQDISRLEKFVKAAHECGLRVALAGSVRAEHLEQLAAIGTDIVGVRGAVCSSHDRNTSIDPEKVRAFVAQARSYASIPQRSAYAAAS